MVQHTALVSFNWTLLMMWVTIAFLYLILKKYFFEKVHDWMVHRAETVQQTIDSADSMEKEAEKKLENYNAQIANVEAEGRTIVLEARKRAEATANNIIEEANEKAAAIKLQAEKEIEREKTKALADMKAQIAMLAMMAAEKIIEKDLSNSDQNVIIENILEEAGRTGWQN